MNLLLISPFDEDQMSLQFIVYSHTKWTLHCVRDIESGKTMLRRYDIAVVLFEKTTDWIDVLQYFLSLDNAPSVIVTSKLADERFWAEALNLGAFDVLAKPFDPAEVLHSVSTGWHFRRDRLCTARTRMKFSYAS